MVSVTIYVEGGGDQNSSLEVSLREGFSKFFEKAGLGGRLPKVVACGPRSNAYKKFKIACQQPDAVILLVDSEKFVNDGHFGKPWEHLAKNPKDKWSRPAHAGDDQCHLMVTCMESWFLADPAALKEYFGKDFAENLLPESLNTEKIPKSSVYSDLKQASKTSQRGCYDKGEHSFKILAEIDPDKVTQASPWAKRLIDHLKSL